MQIFKFTLPLSASPQYHFYIIEDMSMKIWQLDMILQALKSHRIPLDQIWSMSKFSKFKGFEYIETLFIHADLKKNELGTRPCL